MLHFHGSWSFTKAGQKHSSRGCQADSAALGAQPCKLGGASHLNKLKGDKAKISVNRKLLIRRIIKSAPNISSHPPFLMYCEWLIVGDNIDLWQFVILK